MDAVRAAPAGVVSPAWRGRLLSCSLSHSCMGRVPVQALELGAEVLWAVTADPEAAGCVRHTSHIS